MWECGGGGQSGSEGAAHQHAVVATLHGELLVEQLLVGRGEAVALLRTPPHVERAAHPRGKRAEQPRQQRGERVEQRQLLDGDHVAVGHRVQHRVPERDEAQRRVALLAVREHHRVASDAQHVLLHRRRGEAAEEARLRLGRAELHARGQHAHGGAHRGLHVRLLLGGGLVLVAFARQLRVAPVRRRDGREAADGRAVAARGSTAALVVLGEVGHEVQLLREEDADT